MKKQINLRPADRFNLIGSVLVNPSTDNDIRPPEVISYGKIYMVAQDFSFPEKPLQNPSSQHLVKGEEVRVYS